MGCSVSGTAVNGSGTEICAATIVSTVTNSTEAILIPRALSADPRRVARVFTSVFEEDAAMAANCTPPSDPGLGCAMSSQGYLANTSMYW
jgi:hypothetical protein